MRIQGTKYYEARSAYEVGKLRNGESIVFVHEPSNPYDPNAYAAILSNEMRLGHMPAFAAELVRKTCGTERITAKIINIFSDSKRVEIDVEIDTKEIASPASLCMKCEQQAIPAVYAIVNVRNLKAYVGKTTNLDRRRREHIADLQKGKHASPDLQLDWRVAGEDRFALVILDRSPNDIDEAELKRLRQYATNFSRNGYNQGDGWAPGLHEVRRQSGSGAFATRPQGGDPAFRVRTLSTIGENTSNHEPLPFKKVPTKKSSGKAPTTFLGKIFNDQRSHVEKAMDNGARCLSVSLEFHSEIMCFVNVHGAGVVSSGQFRGGLGDGTNIRIINWYSLIVNGKNGPEVFDELVAEENIDRFLAWLSRDDLVDLKKAAWRFVRSPACKKSVGTVIRI